MKLKVFTLRLDPERGVFDDAPVEAFLATRDVLDIDQHFFVHERVPTWCLLVRYRDLERGEVTSAPGPAPREDWRSTLAVEHHARFDALRRWRNEHAQREGRPPYVILTNRQLAEIARRAPRTSAELRAIPGIGAARIEAFGQDVLALVAAAQGEARA